VSFESLEKVCTIRGKLKFSKIDNIQLVIVKFKREYSVCKFRQ
jgi:hypothetical protein